MRATLSATKDILLGLSPWVPNQNGYGLDSLTPQELTAALANGTPGAKIESLRVEIDSRGTTDRARLHLTWNEAGRRAGLPASAFAKGTSTKPVSRIIVSGFGCHTYESRFFAQIQPSLSDLTIAPFVSRAGIGGRYVIAFEDLALRGDVTFYNADDEATKEHAEGVIDLLATLHGRFWRSPRFQTDLSWLETYSRRPGYPFMQRFFSWSENRFMKQDRVVPDPVRRLTKNYVQNQPALVKVWESMPQTLCHGDCHLGNTFSNPDGTAGIYDWQVFHKMNGLRDFAYFMMHSIPTELRRAEEHNLLRRYLHGLAEAGAGSEAPSFDEAFDTYRLLTVDGWIAIVFTLAAGGMQPDDRMEVTAKRAINSLLDLDVERALAAAL
ncbi:phosphotransferase [Nocardia nova]|uniref:phosphotransferase n=1 Tax=Nocardia nova TaxID=37330 RepID=UPI0018950F16|nr:phosphotransferase [Nocardia nova]MBF6149517.1 phosphotransferase [Nocardia nova]